MSWSLSISPASTICLQHIRSRSALCALHRFRHPGCRTGRSRHPSSACCLHSTALHLTPAHRGLHQHKYWQHVRSTACLQQFQSDLQKCQAVANLATSATQHTPSPEKQLTMDYTALVASVQELKEKWIPAKVEQVCLLYTHLAVLVNEPH